MSGITKAELVSHDEASGLIAECVDGRRGLITPVTRSALHHLNSYIDQQRARDEEQSRELAEARARNAELAAANEALETENARVAGLRVELQKVRWILTKAAADMRAIGGDARMTPLFLEGVAGEITKSLMRIDNHAAGGVVAESATSECACVCPVGNPDCSKCGGTGSVPADVEGGQRERRIQPKVPPTTSQDGEPDA